VGLSEGQLLTMVPRQRERGRKRTLEEGFKGRLGPRIVNSDKRPALSLHGTKRGRKQEQYGSHDVREVAR